MTEFREGFAVGLQTSVALVLRRIRRRPPRRDVRHSARAGIAGRLTLLDQSRSFARIPAFRLFATANTIGLGDTTGLYHGTQQINQGQMDRWMIVTTLNYLPHDAEVADRAGEGEGLSTPQRAARSSRPVVRSGRPDAQWFMAGDISTVMCPRTVISWAENRKSSNYVGHSPSALRS